MLCFVELRADETIRVVTDLKMAVTSWLFVPDGLIANEESYHKTCDRNYTERICVHRKQKSNDKQHEEWHKPAD